MEEDNVNYKNWRSSEDMEGTLVYLRVYMVRNHGIEYSCTGDKEGQNRLISKSRQTLIPTSLPVWYKQV